MRIIIEENYEKMSKQAALLVASQIRLKPKSVLGLATGSTPKGMYKELIDMYKNDSLDFSKITTFNLDEYYDISPQHPQSYHYYMYHNFFKHINIKPENYHLLDGTTDNIELECNKYDKKIKKAGGIDLQILGIGSNGHIGFNEPGNMLNVTTHKVNLTEETRKANSRFFDSIENVPKKALTVGMATILKSKRIVLLASGKNKAKVIKKTVSDNVTTWIPSTLLQTHPEITLIIDKEAATLL